MGFSFGVSFGVFVFGSLFPFSLRAQDGFGINLSTPSEIFIEEMVARISPDCRTWQNSAHEKALKIHPFIFSTLRNGWVTLKNINPQLAADSMEARRKFPVTIRCLPDGWSSRTPNYDPKHQVLFLGHFLDRLKEPLTEISPQALVEAENTLFHEFLHHMDLDNLSVDLHGQNHSGGLFGAQKTYDVIYACASAVVPDWREGPMATPQAPVEKKFKHIKLACEKCAAATWKGSQFHPRVGFKKTPISRETKQFCEQLANQFSENTW